MFKTTQKGDLRLLSNLPNFNQGHLKFQARAELTLLLGSQVPGNGQVHGRWARALWKPAGSSFSGPVVRNSTAHVRAEGAERGGPQAEKRDRKLQGRAGGTKMDNTLFYSVRDITRAGRRDQAPNAWVPTIYFPFIGDSAQTPFTDSLLTSH